MRGFVGVCVTFGMLGLCAGFGIGINVGRYENRNFVDLRFTEYPQRLDLRTGAVLEQRFGEWKEIGRYDMRYEPLPVKATDPRLLMTLPDHGGSDDFFPEPMEWKE